MQVISQLARMVREDRNKDKRYEAAVKRNQKNKKNQEVKNNFDWLKTDYGDAV